jgi:DNA-binding transcriptional regulator YhcF (GntR family)
VSCQVLEARSAEARQRLAAQRSQLPPLRELAHAVDAKVETVCRALGALMPPRRWQESVA